MVAQMIIYIPILFVCVAEVCNFMQGQVLHKTEAGCRASIETQKANMDTISKEANQGKITLIEGTCINVDIVRNNV
jgi:hypothetical protein